MSRYTFLEPKTGLNPRCHNKAPDIIAGKPKIPTPLKTVICINSDKGLEPLSVARESINEISIEVANAAATQVFKDRVKYRYISQYNGAPMISAGMYTYIANTSIAKIASYEPVTRIKNNPQVVNSPNIGASKNVAIILIIFWVLTTKLCGANEAQRSLRPNERLVSGIVSHVNIATHRTHHSFHLTRKHGAEYTGPLHDR